MKNSMSLLGLVAAMSAVLVSASSAQDFFDKQELSVPQRCALKLTQQPVAAKVKLNALQQKAILDAQNLYLQESKRIDSEKQPKQEEQVACDKKFANACLSALTPEQKHKILQIGIPEIGVEALMDPAIATQLSLTSAQVTKIREINREYAKKSEDLSAIIADALLAIPEPKAGADRTAYEKKRAETSKMYDGERARMAREKAATEKKAIAVLTPEQQTKWQDLAGTPPKK